MHGVCRWRAETVIHTLGEEKGGTNMRNRALMVILILVAGLLVGGTVAVAAENLGSILRKSGWDRMIGTWVDAQTKGQMYRSVTFWRFKDQVLESLNEDFQEEKQEISLMIYNPKKGEVYQVSADDHGGSTSGRWTFSADEAILDLGFVTPDKQEGLLQFHYRFIDDDTMMLTIVLPKPIEIKMIRVERLGQETLSP